MAKHLSIKTICVSTFILFLAVFGGFQNASAESLSAAYSFGSADSAVTTNVTSVSVSPASSTDVLIVATFSMENVPSTGGTRNGTFQLTDGTFSFGTITRTIDSDDAGIGSIVYIDNGVSVNTTYTLQHQSTIASIKTWANLVAMPLLTSLTSKTLANASTRATGPDTTTSATFSAVTGTPITVTTAGAGVGSLGNFYVAASVQTYLTGAGALTNTGEWQLQYYDNISSTWENIGYPIQRSVIGNSDNGIVNLVGTLANVDASAVDYQFRVAHRRVSGGRTINTANVDIVAVFTGFYDGANDHIFDTYSALIPLASTTSTTLERAGGFNFQPAVNTDLFLHVPYFISAKGKTNATYDLFISGILDTMDQKRALSTANDLGSGASVGLATGLTAGTIYDVQLRHAQDTTGQTITTNNGDILGWDLNSRILGASTCPFIPPQTPVRAPGPDNALFYDGTANYVTVPNNARLNLTDPFSIECWVKPDSIGGTQTLIGKDDGTTLPVTLQLNGSYLEVTYDHSTGTRTLTDGTIAPSFQFATCDWFHAAATLDSGTLTLYVNGVAAETFVGAETPSTNSQPMTIGQSGNSSNYFNGVIDEARIWQNYAFGTTVLRDWMCKKVTSDHPAWSNLSAYYRFDENGLGATVYDYGSWSINGTATNFAFGTERICSSAPVGDESDHDYNGSNPGDFSATLTYAFEGDFMTATGTGGTWTNAGIQLYMVDEGPNNNVPPFAWGTGYVLDPLRYWGVFVANGTSPVYQISYDWTLHQGITKDTWNSLKLAWRDGNCDIPWSPLTAILNTTTRTLTKTGLTGTEFILGGNINSNDPLAITLAYFFAEIEDSGECIRVSWETATEIETIGYYLWRSDSKTEGYTLLSDSFMPAQAVSETTGATYAYTDCSVDLSNGVYYYYKLEEIDFDAQTANPMYGPIGPVSQAATSVKISKSFNSENDSKCFINTLTQ